MKSLLLTIVVLFFCVSAFAQKPSPKGPKFDIDDFNKKVAVAEWLVEYDGVAWKTSDVVMEQDQKELAKLGAEWFCFKEANGTWNAVYGKLTSAGYEMIFRFVLDPAGKVSRSSEKVDQDFLDKHARVLSTAKAKLTASIPPNSPRFNQYVRQNSDKTFSVWLLPAFQTDGTAVYGGEAIYTIDAAGEKILKDESYFQANFRGFKSQPPREIWLNYRDLKKPSLGSVFFVWYYKPYFTKIFIDNEESSTTLMKMNDGYTWVHIEKDESKEPKSK
jgi:hypothetical protein